MKQRPFSFGRRAVQLVPALARSEAGAVVVPTTSDDLRLFALTFAGGLVFFGTFFA